MAELASIGLASNIVGFIDFGLKLFREGKELYDSSQGASIKQLELEIITSDLQHIVDELQPNIVAEGLHPANQATANNDTSLLKLAIDCKSLANELLQVLSTLKVKGDKNRKWESFKQALKGVLKENDIRELETRLDKYRTQLGHHLLYTLSNQSSTVFQTIQNFQDENRRLGSNTSGKLDGIIDYLVKQAKKKNTVDYAELGYSLRVLPEEWNNVKRQQRILRSLSFPSIKVRHELIKQAHRETFQWIFEESTSNFKKWLLSGDGIYWIQGKAGSGKSTLMRLLSEHAKTETALKTWAGECRLIIGSYFFWNAGNSMQKSQNGLLQTLLYQVCRECPYMIEQVFPVRWNQWGPQELELPWTRTELFQSFERLSNFTISSTKFCFFVDGLDEYNGEHQDLVLLMKTLSQYTSMKLCVSSRPWNVFQNAFGQNFQQQLRLEDLTRDDIRKYVRNHLEENPRFRQLKPSDSGYQQIVGDVVDRAHGVFLWVYLVVASLSRGLNNNDSIKDMQRRLNEFPETLEKYFKHMIERIEPFYREDTIHFFEIAVYALQPLPLLAFKFLQDEKERKHNALNAPICPRSDTEIDDIASIMKQRLNARCGDLLEVTKDNSEELQAFKLKVDFLHRTVRDFFLKTDTMNQLRQGGSRTNIQISLCRVMISLLKILPLGRKGTWKRLFSLSDEFMYHARSIEQYNDELTDNSRLKQTLLLEELDRVNSELTQPIPVHWSNFREPPKNKFTENNQKTFLAATIQARLVLYVQEVLKPSDLEEKKGRPLLDYALRPNIITPVEFPENGARPDFAMVRILMERGADVNKEVEIYENKTLWKLFLEHCYDTRTLEGRPSEEESKDFFSIIELLIRNGADPNVTVVTGNKKTIGPTKAFKTFLTRRDFVELEGLLMRKQEGGFSIWKLLGWT